MKDILHHIQTWLDADLPVAVATVVDTWGSAPRPVGSKLAATIDGRFAGSVSAGCVEGAVLEQCEKTIRTGQAALLTYGVADEDAWEVGLACGGTIRVWVEPFSVWQPIFPALADGLRANRSLAVVSPLRDGRPSPKQLIISADSAAGSAAPQLADTVRARLAQNRSGVVEVDGETLFVEVHPSPPRLIIVGGVNIAEPLIDLARALTFETVLVDPRQAFASRERFPNAGEIINGWPDAVLPDLALDENAYVVVLTHDPKIDDPALQAALPSQAAYVGALGSRRTAQKRRDRLSTAGMSQDLLDRLHAPIGLPLGGQSTGEIALSILAEIVQVRNQEVQLFPQS